MIYRDAFGRPDALATVSMFGGIFAPAYYSLSHINNCPDRKWSGDTPAEAIAAEMEADGWRCSIRKNGFGQPVIDCVHSETQSVIDAKQAADNAKFSDAERGYIRFGAPPAGGRSRNHEVSYLAIADRPAYRLYGERVGTGSDGEPVLRVDRAIKLYMGSPTRGR